MQVSIIPIAKGGTSRIKDTMADPSGYPLFVNGYDGDAVSVHLYDHGYQKSKIPDR